MGLIREDGSAKMGVDAFAALTPALGICQWFHFEDHRLDPAVRWLKQLGVRHVRTGLSWADSFRHNALAWFDRQMDALAEFDVTVTFCFTPEHRGIAPHHTSAPQVNAEFAEFCARMIDRYSDHIQPHESYSGLGLRPPGAGGPEKEQTFSPSVTESNIIQERLQGNAPPRTS
jgi:beta-xylosidase